MGKYNLVFDNFVVELEEEYRWLEVTEWVYQQWKKNSEDLNCLLCAGTELWYILLEANYYENNPKISSYIEILDKELVMKRLIEITRYGEEKFANEAIFNSYFGFMINVYPYFFVIENSYEEWLKKGHAMIDYSYKLEPDNLFVKAIYCEQTDSENETTLFEGCKEMWSVTTPEQWGNSGVKQYFFYRLLGDYFYPDAYEKGNKDVDNE